MKSPAEKLNFQYKIQTFNLENSRIHSPKYEGGSEPITLEERRDIGGCITLCPACHDHVLFRDDARAESTRHVARRKGSALCPVATCRINVPPESGGQRRRDTLDLCPRAQLWIHGGIMQTMTTVLRPIGFSERESLSGTMAAEARP